MIVGFGFTKIIAEKKTPAQGKVDVNNNISIKSIETTDFSLVGEIIYVDEPKNTKEILEYWNKEKKIKNEIMASILNAILSKCNIQALIISQEINLPPPIPMPKVSINKQNDADKGYIG